MPGLRVQHFCLQIPKTQVSNPDDILVEIRGGGSVFYENLEIFAYKIQNSLGAAKKHEIEMKLLTRKVLLLGRMLLIPKQFLLHCFLNTLYKGMALNAKQNIGFI